MAEPGAAAPLARARAFVVGSGSRMPWIALLVLTTLLIVIEGIPLSRLDVPFTTHGDAIDKLTQINTVAETGWLFDNDRLGYPFGYDRLDFPRFDSLNYAILGPVAAITREPGVAMNLYYLATFYLIAFAAFWCLRRLAMDAAPAVLAALVYAFLPYHLLRGVPHLTNGAYFLVPFAMLVLLRLAQGRLDFDAPGSRKSLYLSLLVAVLVPLQTPYNGVFFALLCIVAAFVAVAHTRSWRPLPGAVALMAATGGAFLVEQLPVIVHAQEHGKTFAAERPASGAQYYSLQLNQVVLPTSADRRPVVARAMHRFQEELDIPQTENHNQYIGAFGVFGFGALAWSLFRASRRRDASDIASADDTEVTLRIAALLAIAIVLLAISTGFGTIVSFWITAKIRAWNRILPFLAFACMIGGAWLLQSALARIRHSTLRRVAFGVVCVLALFDVLVRPHYQLRAEDVAQWDADRAYFRAVERELGAHAALFELPAVWYPEHPPMARMIDYDEFKPYLMSDTLRVSYGGSQGRAGYNWARFTAAKPAPKLVAAAHSMGFSAILLDAYAYEGDPWFASTTDALTQLLPKPPIVSPDRRWWTFALDGCCGAPIAPIEPATLPQIFAWNPASGPISFAAGGTGVLYDAGGWQEPEDWGVWSSTEARLRLRIDPAPQRAFSLLVDARMLVGPRVPERNVKIEGNGRQLGEFAFSTAHASQQFRLDVPAGTLGKDGSLELGFVTTPAATAASAGVNSDPRPLAIGLVSLGIASGPP
ncbi:MAG: hypothetical protein ABW186_09490 [Rhodanobacteraceae bacterium]